jgi:hypothetical protein
VAASGGGGGCIKARTEVGRRAVTHRVTRMRSVRKWRVRTAEPRRTAKVTAMTMPRSPKMNNQMVERHLMAREWRIVLNVDFLTLSSKVESHSSECACSSAENEIHLKSNS